MFIIFKLYAETGANHFQVLLVHVGPYILIENDHSILFPHLSSSASLLPALVAIYFLNSVELELMSLII